MSELAQRRRERYVSVSDRKFLPAAPLADAVMRMAERSDLRTVCARAGVQERVVTRWRRGESGAQVEVDDADAVLTRLGLAWWEIWTEETVREPLFVVTTYRNGWKKSHDVSCWRRLKDRTIPYGDLGTDYYRLREISRLMTGEAMAA